MVWIKSVAGPDGLGQLLGRSPTVPVHCAGGTRRIDLVSWAAPDGLHQ